MPTNQREIVAEIKDHISRLGGKFSAWCVGTARDVHSPFFERHLVAETKDEFIYREAFTPASAQAARNYLVNECGLRLDLEDAPEPGRIVFAYCKAAPARSEPGRDDPSMNKLAA